MKLALESSTSLLDKVQGFGDFDWISAPRAAKDKVYLEFYQKSDRARVLSTNDGNCEPDLKQVKGVWESLGSNAIIVSPDYNGKQIETLMAYDAYAQEFGVENIIGVLQGASYKEVLGCAGYYKGEVAVPCRIGSGNSTSNSLMSLRRALVVSNIPADRYIHLLGFNTIDELEWYENKPNVLSMNTGYPIYLGLKEADILDLGKDCNKPEPTLDAIEKIEAVSKKGITQTQWTAIIRNIALLRRYIS